MLAPTIPDRFDTEAARFVALHDKGHLIVYLAKALRTELPRYRNGLVRRQRAERVRHGAGARRCARGRRAVRCEGGGVLPFADQEGRDGRRQRGERPVKVIATGGLAPVLISSSSAFIFFTMNSTIPMCP